MKFVIVPSGGQYYFRILAANNRTLANSERYHNRADCQNAINLIKAGRLVPCGEAVLVHTRIAGGLVRC